MTSAAGGDRTRRLWQGIGAAVPARIAQMVSPLILIPWLLGYLGDSLYGLWMATTAVVGMLSFADLGLGNAVMARLPPFLAAQNVDAARRLVSNSYALLAGLSAALMGVAVLVGSLVPIGVIIGSSTTEDPSVARSVLLVTSLTFLANIPLSLINRVQFARQRSGQVYLIAALSSILALGLTILAAEADLGPVTVIAVNLGLPPLVNLVYTVILFAGSLRSLAPSPAMLIGQDVWSAFRGGLPFLVLTVLLSSITASDYLLIGRLVGIAQVTEFSVAARLLLQAGALVTLVTMPFWPASSDAFARQDLQWVRTARRRMSILGASIMVVVLAGLLVLGPWFYGIWLGPGMPFSTSLVAGLGVWWFLQALLSPTFMVQNGLARLTPQVIGAVLYLGFSIPAKAVLVPIHGVAAIGWTSAACYILTILPAALLGHRRVMGEQRVAFSTQEVL